MAFRFRLEKVLNYRQNIVDQRSREAGMAARALALVNTRIETLQGEIFHLLNGRLPSRGSLDLQSLQQNRNWLDHLDAQLKNLQAERTEAAAEMERRRVLLTAAWRDLEVLKKLKERKKAAWQEEELRRENQDLDEIGQIRADRHNREKLAASQAQPAGPAAGHC